MARWYYRGKTPTPIAHPERGSIIVTPRMTFEAPESSVAHIMSMVKRLPDPPPTPEVAPVAPIAASVVVSSPPVPPVAEVLSNRRSVQEEVEGSSDSAGHEAVLESEPTSTQVEEAEEADRASDSAPPAQKKTTQNRVRNGTR